MQQAVDRTQSAKRPAGGTGVRDTSAVRSARHKSYASELKAIGIALLALLLLEGYARLKAQNPAWDYQRLRDIPRETQAATNDPARPTVVLLGNSLTRNGYDLPTLLANLPPMPDGRPPLQVVNAALYGATMNEWYYVLKTKILSASRPPKAVVLNLSPGVAVDRAPGQLRVGWLAAETDWHDLPELAREDFRSFETSAEYATSRLSIAYAQRWDLRAGFLFNLIPAYADGAKWINDHGAADAVRDQSAAAPQPTYQTLRRIFDLAKAHDVRVIVLAMPVRDPYPLDPRLIELTHAAGQIFLDCRAAPGLSKPSYEPDGWHMTPAGAKIFSRWVAPRMGQALESRDKQPAAPD